MTPNFGPFIHIRLRRSECASRQLLCAPDCWLWAWGARNAHSRLRLALRPVPPPPPPGAAVPPYLAPGAIVLPPSETTGSGIRDRGFEPRGMDTSIEATNPSRKGLIDDE